MGEQGELKRKRAEEDDAMRKAGEEVAKTKKEADWATQEEGQLMKVLLAHQAATKTAEDAEQILLQVEEDIRLAKEDKDRKREEAEKAKDNVERKRVEIDKRQQAQLSAKLAAAADDEERRRIEEEAQMEQGELKRKRAEEDDARRK